MELINSLTVYHGSEKRHIQLFFGDLTSIPPAEAVDVLVVSAFPNDYLPTSGSLIGALNRKGVSVAQLAQSKFADLRQAFSCWMSDEVHSSDPGIQFKRILCFEPHYRGRPPEVVGDIFQSLMPFVNIDNPPMRSVAMPLVATGDQRYPVVDILEPLLDAAVHWLSMGLPITHLKIVIYSRTTLSEAREIFTRFKSNYLARFESQTVADTDKAQRKFRYDAFISYSHENGEEVSRFVDALMSIRQSTRLFMDRKDLDVGVAWQQEIFNALDDCHRIIAFYSPAYLASKVCREEFNIALFRHRDSETGTLIPIYLYSADLPTYMKLIQYIDCREADTQKLVAACHQIANNLEICQ